MPLRGRGGIVRQRARLGFTLVELLTALIVLSVASTVLIKMFLSSQSLGKAGHTHELAADLAQEYMTLLRERPDLFDWPDFAEQKPGTAVSVAGKPKGALSSVLADPPAALPLLRRANLRESGTYRNFSWSATARQPSPEANYMELTVTILWELEGRFRQFMLTSAAPLPTSGGPAQ